MATLWQVRTLRGDAEGHHAGTGGEEAEGVRRRALLAEAAGGKVSAGDEQLELRRM